MNQRFDNDRAREGGGRKDGKNFANAKFYKEDFSGRDLTNADFRGSVVSECNFDNADLTRANFTDANCYRATFRGARMSRTNFTNANLVQAIIEPRDMTGIAISMQCETFNGIKISDKFLVMWLYSALMMDIPDNFRQGLRALIGEEKCKNLDRFLRDRDF